MNKPVDNGGNTVEIPLTTLKLDKRKVSVPHGSCDTVGKALKRKLNIDTIIENIAVNIMTFLG